MMYDMPLNMHPIEMRVKIVRLQANRFESIDQTRPGQASLRGVLRDRITRSRYARMMATRLDTRGQLSTKLAPIPSMSCRPKEKK